MGCYNSIMNSIFLRRLQDIFGKDFAKVEESFSLERLPVVRINTLVVTEADGLARLAELGFEPKQVLLDKNAYVLQARTKRDLTDSEEYQNGWYYIQSLSSMVPVWSIEDEVRTKIANEEEVMVFDMCAAPGSKTTQLSAVMEGRGQIIAYDLSRQRMYSLRANLEQQQADNVQVVLGNAEPAWRKYGPVFDYVLLDAPCSGEGRFSVLDDSGEDWNMRKIERLSSEQKRLIFSAVMCLKPGGALIYSTCTFAPEENEAVVQFALEKFEGAVEAEEMKISDNAFLPGLTSWKGTQFGESVTKSIRIRPDRQWEGFFVSMLRRK